VIQPGVSLDVSNEMGNLLEEALLTIPEVSSTARRTGRGELDEHSQATNSAEIDVNFHPPEIAPGKNLWKRCEKSLPPFLALLLL
jgi:Cu/Ag efflux pump CusA